MKDNAPNTIRKSMVVRESYPVSVLVATYNQTWEKLVLTLKSVFLQRGIDYQIVVTDDGSKDNLFDKIEGFFKEQGFKDYVLTGSRHNTGTVKNVIRGVSECYGEYVKPISPGDCLYGRDILAGWVKNAKTAGAVISFSDTVNYFINADKKIQLVKRKANPNKVSNFVRGGAETQRRLPALQRLVYRCFHACAGG